MPASLHLNTSQVSLVASGVPLGAVGGALLLGPTNEAVGRRMAIIISLILYTIGGALEAGAINFGMIVAGRVILGLGVGLEGGTVCLKRDLRGYSIINLNANLSRYPFTSPNLLLESTEETLSHCINSTSL